MDENIINENTAEETVTSSEVETPQREENISSDEPKKNENKYENMLVTSVRFKEGGKVYYFSPRNIYIKTGQYVIVETIRGLELGYVSEGNHFVKSAKITQPLKCVVRIATDEDRERYQRNMSLAKEAMKKCEEFILQRELEMKLIDAEYTFDNSKLIFYFTSDSRVDFRELVKDLASEFKTRIELRQIGIRDEAKMVGGLGVCGRPFCCSTFLPDFVQVSIKMAKEQSLSLNSAKISGACGRLMCCLRFENESYELESRNTPKVGTKVKVPQGVGEVVEANVLTGLLKIRITNESGDVFVYENRDNIKII